MLKLETKIPLEELQGLVNINDRLSEEDSSRIGAHVCQGYDVDKRSRDRWEKQYHDALELAQQIIKEKGTPWAGASNVKFPLLTIAALQFASRAYPTLVKAPDLVKFRVQGQDPQGLKAARAMRISSHMSYQLLEEDESWEESQDKAFIALPILGSIFKKTYYHNGNQSKLVLPYNLVVNYYATSLEDCERKTEILPKMSTRKYRELVAQGVFTEHDFSAPGGKGDSEARQTADKRQGTREPTDDYTPRQPLEQHCYLDLDGDGYEEPYIVTVDQDSQKVLRIRARFSKIVTEESLAIEKIDGQIASLAAAVGPPVQDPTPQQQEEVSRIAAAMESLQAEKEELAQQTPTLIRIEPKESYTKYSFIPSPDGGFYDLGFGALLSPLNSSVDTLINQLIDSGTLNNGSVGFIGKGARIRGGRVLFSPNEWKKVDVTGSNLRENLVPLPVNQPSPVLFNLLSLLINYTERISSVSEITSGQNPGQNTPAYNMSAMLEQGLQIFNAIFKRCYRAFRSELRKMYQLNAEHLSPKEYFEYQDRAEMWVLQADYLADPKDLIPAADPNAFSDRERQQKAMVLAERAMAVPGYDRIKVEQRFIEAMDIPNAAEIFPVVQDPQTGQIQLVYQPGEDPDLTIKKMEEARRTAEGETRLKIQWQQAMADIALKEAQVVEVYARAEKLADSIELERIKTLQKELADQRKHIQDLTTEEEKEDDSAETDKGLDGEPGDERASEAGLYPA